MNLNIFLVEAIVRDLTINLIFSARRAETFEWIGRGRGRGADAGECVGIRRFMEKLSQDMTACVKESI